MFVKLTRTFRNSPFVELRESDAQYLADVVVTDAELAANKRSRSEQSLSPRFSPRTPWPLTPWTIVSGAYQVWQPRAMNALIRCQRILL